MSRGQSHDAVKAKCCIIDITHYRMFVNVDDKNDNRSLTRVSDDYPQLVHI